MCNILQIYLIVVYVQFDGLLYYGVLYVGPLCGGFDLVESRCGHVSMVLLGHSVHFGFGNKLGQKIIFTVVTHVLGIAEF